MDTVSTVSTLDNDTVSQGRGCVNLDPTATAAQRADLDAARRDFPRYRIEIEPTPGRLRFIARQIKPGPGPHTLITSDLTELRAELNPIDPPATGPGQDGTHD
jgi:hypothetical protein